MSQKCKHTTVGTPMRKLSAIQSSALVPRRENNTNTIKPITKITIRAGAHRLLNAGVASGEGAGAAAGRSPSVLQNISLPLLVGPVSTITTVELHVCQTRGVHNDSGRVFKRACTSISYRPITTSPPAACAASCVHTRTRRSRSRRSVTLVLT